MALSAPSVLSSTERNVLLRAASPLFAQLKIVDTQEFRYDERLWKAASRAGLLRRQGAHAVRSR